MNQLFCKDCILGTSERMKDIYSVIKKVSKLKATVLITGESGTGKELLARIIYKESGDPNLPFVTVNLPSIPKKLVESTLFGHEKGSFTSAHKQHIGKFELAHNGILFLDEVAELPYDLQAKLLRALQEGEIERVGGSTVIKVDVRIIAATNNDLKEAVSQGTFREDLYYRLNVIPIHLPPLRERIEDIPQLADLFVKKYKRKFAKNIQGFTDSAIKVLVGCPWPGNIRELENLIERLVATAETDLISPEDIPMEYYSSFLDNNDGIPENELLRKARAAYERNFILRTLEQMQWNRKKTAEILGISNSTLKYKMTQLNIYQIIKARCDE
ncbi:MAG: sigma-54 interaction domain-containing protein [bacterium]